MYYICKTNRTYVNKYFARFFMKSILIILISDLGGIPEILLQSLWIFIFQARISILSIRIFLRPGFRNFLDIIIMNDEA